MTTGTLSGGVCFPTQKAAATNECSLMSRSGSAGLTCGGVSAGPSATQGGTVVALLQQRWQTAGSSTTTTLNYSYALPACELEDYWPWPMSASDGGLVATAIAACWLGAAAWRYVRRSTD